MSLSQVSQPIQIYFSYAPKDKGLFDELIKHLSVLKQQGYIGIWNDSAISVGGNKLQIIDMFIYKADIIVLLLSPDFLASSDCFEFEMKRALERDKAGAARILSILLRPFDWKGLPLERSGFLPPDGKPISLWSNRDAAFLEVVKGIRKVVEELTSQFVNVFVHSNHPKDPLWNVPYRRNPLFTGRQNVFDTLHDHFVASQPSHTRIQALNGLGGIGKTQIAIEYAYRYQDEYQAVFWVKADSHDLFRADIAALADMLHLPKKSDTDEQDLFTAVKLWLQHHQKWLLLLDNLMDFALIDLLVPFQCSGHVLLTTHFQATGTLAQTSTITSMSPDESTFFLLRRAKITDETSANNYSQAISIVQAVDGLPLALDQAGSYIEETGCGLAGYLTLYHQRRATLLQLRGNFTKDHPQSVMATLALTFAKVTQANPSAMELLRLFAFLHPDVIPDEMIIQGAPALRASLQSLATDPLAFPNAISTLLSFSLVSRSADATTSSIHRIVQAVLKDALSSEQQRQWAIRVVRLVNRVFPNGEVSTWTICQRYLPQAQTCATLITKFRLTHHEAAQLLHRLGYYCYERSLYTEAETHLTYALRLREQYLGPKHIDTAESLNTLALLYSQQGQYQRAELFEQHSLEIYEQALGPDHPKTASILNNLALLYCEQGRYSLAEPIYLRVLALYEQMPEPDRSEAATTLNNLGLLYHEQGKHSLAEQAYQRALALRETILDPWHPDLAQSLSNLAALYQEQEKYQQAEPLLMQALHIRERTLGLEHPDTALSLNNLALFYRLQGSYQQAEPLYQHAIAIQEQTLGATHPKVALTLNNLGRLYHIQGKYQQAEPLYLRAIAIQEQVLDSDHPETALSLKNLAELYTTQNHYQQAELLYQRALAIYKNAFGETHSDVTLTLERYASLLEQMQRTEEATTLRLTASQTKQPRVQDVADQAT